MPQQENMPDIIEFDRPRISPSIIMVTGVGGGGSNAVNHMFDLGIADVSFMVCNTDRQALYRSPVPIKVRLGRGSARATTPKGDARPLSKALTKSSKSTSAKEPRWSSLRPEWAAVPVRVPHR